jgi:GH15 family glucan-1,4-alpha-glucosidase
MAARDISHTDGVGDAIADYAVIGDCRTAALISRRGSIDWLCLPYFSSPSVFGAILDRSRGGSFSVRLDGLRSCSRRYVEGTNVLETTLWADGAAVRLTDFMPLPEGAGIAPMREVLRRVECIEGDARLCVEISPKPDYGRRKPRLERRGPRSWTWSWGNEWLRLAPECELTPAGDAVVGDIALRGGQEVWMSLVSSKGEIGVHAPLGAAAVQRLESTLEWWRDWSGRARYEGPHRKEVLRSALVLKLLTYCLSGAVVAAPTTSLPEALGAERNWDYRYCWLRDAALTMRALTRLGYFDEARSFLDWLLHATRLTWPRLRVLYDVYGRPEIDETALPHWRGFRESRPVRIGNAAEKQLQLDVYGAVCFAAREFWRATGELTSPEARLLQGFARTAGNCWQEPDHGLWEIRGTRRHYTFSKVMCWVALDVANNLSDAGLVDRSQRCAEACEAIRNLVETRGYSAGLRSYVATLDGDRADASLLLLSALGYQDARSSRMRSTFALVHRQLERHGLLMRYCEGTDGFPSREGAFGICSFWAVDQLARRGDVAAARRTFERVLGYSNDVGLLAEEIDPETGTQLGNFPQAYTHVGVINAALAVAAAERAS